MEKDFYKTYFEVEKNHWWFRVRRNIIISIISNISNIRTIHDFGCGSGYTVGYLQKLGYDASGTDVSPEAIEFGLSKGIRNLSVAQNAEIKAIEGGFDLILALDVIEHIQDDLGAIRAIEMALRPGGTAIITVPAYQWLWGVQDEVAHHFRRHTMTGLTSIVKKSGDFKVVRKTCFNTFLFLPIVIVRIFSKWFNLGDRESDFDVNNRFLNGIFYLVFDLERRLLNYVNFPFGVSVLMVLKK